MKTFVVLAAVCISACVAAPNGYSHSYGVVRQALPSYSAPVLTTTTAAPLLLRNSYGSYEQPAEFRVVKKQQIPIVRYHLNDDNLGTFRLETESADSSTFNLEGNLKNLPGDNEGPVTVMKGSYSFVGDDSKTYTVNYVADENGFRAEGAHLPTPHPEIQQALMMMGPGSD